MLFISVTRPECIQCGNTYACAVELRLDLFPQIDFAAIRKYIQTASFPVMLTLRKSSQGGGFRGTESEREELIEKLLSLTPSFFDLEYDMRPEFLQKIFCGYPQIKFVLSYHDFQKTPTDLENIYCEMRKYAVFCYKIAAMAHSTNDALKMLLFSQKHPQVSAICMGERGEFARVLGPVVGNCVNFASMDAERMTGPGQLAVSELVETYRYFTLNQNTSVYGLIGDPIAKSPGHLHHNAVFCKRSLNAVYVKMVVKPEELTEFLSLATALGIRGLSVTIPLKEKILPFLQEIDSVAKEIGAINTLLLQKGKVMGTNTDGCGALDAIEKRIAVRGKTVVLIGAGGAARAIAFEAKLRGADVLILNRTVQRANELAKEIGCRSAGLADIPGVYDVLVNCSPDPLPIDFQKIKPKTVAMDVVYFPRETLFLTEALRKQCQVVYGEEMFLNQAAGQTAFWVGPC